MAVILLAFLKQGFVKIVLTYKCFLILALWADTGVRIEASISVL